MATDLSHQLRLLREGHAPAPRHGRVSFLFSSREAGDMDMHTVHRIGRDGFQELCRVDARFLPYDEPLFGDAARDLNRELQTEDVNRRLDASIATFMREVSPLFMLQATHRALEFLVRRFRCVWPLLCCAVSAARDGA